MDLENERDALGTRRYPRLVETNTAQISDSLLLKSKTSPQRTNTTSASQSAHPLFKSPLRLRPESPIYDPIMEYRTSKEYVPPGPDPVLGGPGYSRRFGQVAHTRQLEGIFSFAPPRDVQAPAMSSDVGGAGSAAARMRVGGLGMSGAKLGRGDL